MPANCRRRPALIKKSNVRRGMPLADPRRRRASSQRRVRRSRTGAGKGEKPLGGSTGAQPRPPVAQRHQAARHRSKLLMRILERVPAETGPSIRTLGPVADADPASQNLSPRLVRVEAASRHSQIDSAPPSREGLSEEGASPPVRDAKSQGEGRPLGTHPAVEYRVAPRLTDRQEQQNFQALVIVVVRGLSKLGQASQVGEERLQGRHRPVWKPQAAYVQPAYPRAASGQILQPVHRHVGIPQQIQVFKSRAALRQC